MDVTAIAETLRDIRTEDDEPDNGLKLIGAKVGQLHEASMTLEAAEEHGVDDDKIDGARRDLIAGIVVACAEYAEEHDIDLETAIEERLELMREQAEQLAQDVEDEREDDDPLSDTGPGFY